MDAPGVIEAEQHEWASQAGPSAGLKGLRVGDASVSLKHANFIINHGAATAADLEQLVLQVQAQVQATHGIALQPEVRILGEAL